MFVTRLISGIVLIILAVVTLWFGGVVTGIVTMLAIACGFIIGHGPIYIFFYGIAITLSLCFLYKAWTDVSRIQERRDEYQEEFDSRWVCPKCGRPIQAKNYIVLSKLDACPYCKTKFNK